MEQRQPPSGQGDSQPAITPNAPAAQDGSKPGQQALMRALGPDVALAPASPWQQQVGEGSAGDGTIAQAALPLPKTHLAPAQHAAAAAYYQAQLEDTQGAGRKPWAPAAGLPPQPTPTGLQPLGQPRAASEHQQHPRAAPSSNAFPEITPATNHAAGLAAGGSRAVPGKATATTAGSQPALSPRRVMQSALGAATSHLQAARHAAAMNMHAVGKAAHDVRTALLSGVPPGATSTRLPDLAPYLPPSAGQPGSSASAAPASTSSSFTPHPNTVYLNTGQGVPLAQPPMAFHLSSARKQPSQMHSTHAGSAGAGGADASPAAVRGSALRLATWRLFRALDSGPVAAAVWRSLVAAYYMNLAYEQLEVWWRLAGTVPHKRWSADPDPHFPFPYAYVWVVLPAALSVAAGLWCGAAGSVLLATSLLQDAWLTYRQVVNIVWYGARPNELVAKRLAMAGAALLVVAHAFRDTAPAIATYAGMLTGEDECEEDADTAAGSGAANAPPPTAGVRSGQRGRAGLRKSAVLLAARLMMTALMLFTGWMQSLRIMSRDWALVRSPASWHYGIPDSHDNNWLLLELALAIPFALGYKTAITSRALACVMALEALTCWQWWTRQWPSWHYRAHVRLHFFTNMALAGALGLLLCAGAGSFTLDRAIAAAKKRT